MKNWGIGSCFGANFRAWGTRFTWGLFIHVHDDGQVLWEFLWFNQLFVFLSYIYIYILYLVSFEKNDENPLDPTWFHFLALNPWFCQEIKILHVVSRYLLSYICLTSLFSITIYKDRYTSTSSWLFWFSYCNLWLVSCIPLFSPLERTNI